MSIETDARKNTKPQYNHETHQIVMTDWDETHAENLHAFLNKHGMKCHLEQPQMDNIRFITINMQDTSKIEALIDNWINE